MRLNSNFLSDFWWELLQNIFFEAADHDFLGKQEVQLTDVRHTRVIHDWLSISPCVLRFFGVAISMGIFKKVIKNIWPEHL
jgi:hypothetical protein